MNLTAKQLVLSHMLNIYVGAFSENTEQFLAVEYFGIKAPT